MKRWGSLAFLLISAGVAQAQPTLEILSPVAGDCVNNGPEIFRGGVAGGEAQAEPTDIALELRVSSPDGGPVALRFAIDGVDQFEAEIDPAQAGVPEVTDLYVVPALFIMDGEDKNITITAVHNGQQAVDSVTFDLDRRAPTAVLADEVLEQLGQCFAQQPDTPFEIEDEFDPNPTSEVSQEVDGCNVTRVVLVRDHCGSGNAQAINIVTRRPAQAGQVTIEWEGTAEGAHVAEARLNAIIEGPAGCEDSVEATLTRDGGPPEVLIFGDRIDVPGEYVATVVVGSCGQEVARAVRRFTVLPSPDANAGGPYQGVQGEFIDIDGSDSIAPEEFPIIEWAWDLNDDGFFDPDEGDGPQTQFDSSVGDGEHTIRLRITASNGTVDFAQAQVTVQDIDPICAFTEQIYEGIEGEPVQFDASASGPGHESDPLVAFAWNFGDNRFPQRGAGLTAPIHIFAESGEYRVTVTVEDVDSSTACTAQVVIDDIPPIIEGIGALAADNLVECQRVHFTAGQTRPGSGQDPIQNYRWTFGQGQGREEGANLRNPSRIYTDSGDFEVCLEVSDEDDQIEECFDITIRDIQPVAEMNGPRAAVEGDEVCFNVGNSRAGVDGDCDALDHFEWDFGDGTPPQETPIAQREICHRFVDNGAFTVTLSVHDEDSVATAEQPMTVSDVAPRAVASAVFEGEDRFGLEGLPVQFDASESRAGSDADPITLYRWNFGDGTIEEGAELVRIQHAFPDDGDYVVTLTVIDEDDSSDRVEFSLEVRNVAPQVHIEVEDALQIEIGVATEFCAVVVDVPADAPTFQWDMGDGTLIDEGPCVSHAFERLGDLTVTVTADDGDGGTDEATQAVRITRAAPRIEAPRSISGREGQPIVLVATVRPVQLEPGVFDELSRVTAPQVPMGAELVTEELGEPGSPIRLTLRWTPGYTDAGAGQRVVISATAVSGLTRTHNVALDIAEAGTPWLAMSSGSAAAGRVTLYEYGNDGVGPTFRAVTQVPVGRGAVGVAAPPRGGRLFVAVPGSSGVAVIDALATPPALVRTIPTGDGPSAVVFGALGNAGYIWALNAGESSLSIIDPVTLKVERTVDLGLDQPVDLAWIAAGVDGLGAARLAITARGTGRVVLIDPAAALAGEANLSVASVRLGGLVQRIVLDEATGWLAIAEAKSRRVYQITASDLEAGNAEGVRGTRLPFAATDLAARDGEVWATTQAGLVRVPVEGDIRVLPQFEATSVATVPESMQVPGDLVFAGGNEVTNLGVADLSRQSTAPGSRGRRMAAFVARE